MTRTSLILAAALSASVAVPAVATELTTVEQIQLQTALENDDRATAAFLLSGAERNPADVSAFQLAVAEEDDNHAFARFLRSGGSETISTQGGVNAGGAKLAETLGVNPSDYTTAELVALYLDLGDD